VSERTRGGWPAQPPGQGPGEGGYGPQSGRRQPGYGPGPGPSGRPRRRRRRHHRGLIALVVIVVVLAVAAVIGDQAARSYAQNRVAEQIQSSGLDSKPSVKIEGWPFLTQIAGHDLRAVDISASNVTADSGKLTFSFTARATGVHLSSSFSSATVDQISARAVVPFSSLPGLLSAPAGTISFSADPANGPNALKASSPLGTLTGKVSLQGQSKIVIQLGSGTGLASVLGGLSGQAFSIELPKLPAGVVIRSVSVSGQGIVALGSASNTTLTQ
jgi:LmeA-like phospholipid-binding